MPEMIQELFTALVPYIITIVTAIVGYWAAQLKSRLDQKLDTEVKKQVVEDTVKYVQQVYETLAGPEKLQKAIQTASEWLQEKNIKVTEAELTVLIESTIKAAKDGWYSTPVETLPETIVEEVEIKTE